MKFTLFITLLFVIPLLSTAQRITYNDLYFMVNHSLDKTEDLLSKKGFEFSKADTIAPNSQLARARCQFTKNSSTSVQYMVVDVSGRDNLYFEASFDTSFSSEYRMFKATIVKEGYKLIGNQVYNGNLMLVYRKGNWDVDFMLSKSPGLKTDYYITLTNNYLERIATAKQIQ